MSRPALFLAALTAACEPPTVATPDDTDPAVDTEVVATDTDVADTTPTDPCREQPAVVELGTGDTAFLPLVDGQDLPVAIGSEGGIHHTLSVRTTNTPQLVILHFTAVDVATSQSVLRISPMTVNALLSADPAGPWACAGTFDGFHAVLDQTLFSPGVPDYRALCGRELELGVRVRGPDGVELGSDTVRIISQPDPSDGERCEP